MVIGLGAALAAAVLFGVGAVVQAVAVRRHGLFSPMVAVVVAGAEVTYPSLTVSVTV